MKLTNTFEKEKKRLIEYYGRDVEEFMREVDDIVSDLEVEQKYAQTEHDERIRLEERVKLLELQLKYCTEEQKTDYDLEEYILEGRTDWSSVEEIVRKIREERG